MSAPPDSNHVWKRDQQGRWYYLDRQNRPVYLDTSAPRYTGPPTGNVQFQPNNALPPNPQYQHRSTAPHSAARAFGVSNIRPQASCLPPNAPTGQPLGPGAGRGSLPSSGPTSQPITIPATSACTQPATGQGRGAPRPSGPQSQPSSGYSKSPGVGQGRGQLATGVPLSSTHPAYPQGLSAGRGRGAPGVGNPQPLPAAGYAQQSGVGRGSVQTPGSGQRAPPQPTNSQNLVVRPGRGNVPGGVSAVQQQPGASRPPNTQPPAVQQLPGPSQPTNAQPLAVQQPPGPSRPTNAQPVAQSQNQLQQRLIATPEQRGTLNENFKVRRQARNFFRLGKVFLALHTESYGQTQGRPGPSTWNTPNNDVFVVAFGELVFTKVRRFIVVREDLESCTALAITTHSGRGAARRNASEHGVVYTGARSPPSRFRNETGILPTAIRIDPFDSDDTLHVASRVNYGKVYNIEHNVKVKPYGVVNNQFMHALITQWTQVFIGRTGNLAQLAFRTPGQPTLRALGFTPTQINGVINILARRGSTPYNAITSMARASAEMQLVADDRAERTVKRLANHVVDLILAGMTYPTAVSHVQLIEANEEADDDEDDDDDEDEDEDVEDDD